MAYKLSFQFHRQNSSGQRRDESDANIKTTLQGHIDKEKITNTMIYPPSRNTIKVLFDSEEKLNKALDKKEKFRGSGFTLKLPMGLKASRTIFCAGIDQAIFTTYTPNDIKECLIGKGWEVVGIYYTRN